MPNGESVISNPMRSVGLDLWAIDRSAPLGVQDAVANSWRRSRLATLDPTRCAAAPGFAIELGEGALAASTKIVEAKLHALGAMSVAFVLTDLAGTIARRWVSNAVFARELDHAGIAEGMNVSEPFVGTSSFGIVLETDQPTLVQGTAHFAEPWSGLTTAGAPVRNRATRRRIATINVVVHATDTSPVLLPWVVDVAAGIGEALGRSLSIGDSSLLDAFLAENRDSRHPVVCLNDSTVISNVVAARLLSAEDHALLWETVRRADGAPAATSLTLTNGLCAKVHVRRINGNDSQRGAIVQLRVHASDALPMNRDTGEIAGLVGLVGQSAAWRSLVRQVRGNSGAAMLVTGEVGTGRLAVATARAPERRATVLDCRACESDPDRWLQQLAFATRLSDAHLVLREVGFLAAAHAERAKRLLDAACSRGLLVTGTMATDADRHSNAMGEWFDTRIEVPPLRNRLDDLPLLVAALSARHRAPHPSPRWMPEVVQALTRLTMTHNVASLDALVRSVVTSSSSPYIGMEDLPADARVEASRRRLVGLERAEAEAILAAMKDAAGNKRRAAEMLGISRSTLYRKVRALGIELSVSPY